VPPCPGCAPLGHGGTGYCTGIPVERIFRDVRVLRLYEGTSEVQRNFIAKSLLRD
jgi:acyl-CoA dehydrogenase